MTQFYTKNEDGSFKEADDLVEQEFQEKSGKIVSLKLNAGREKMATSIREEISEEVRRETTDAIRREITDELSEKHQVEINAVKKENEGLAMQLRRKNIAAEYGFKADDEEFLGEGSDEDMRAKADTLKASFESSRQIPAPDKKTKDDGSTSSFVQLCD